MCFHPICHPRCGRFFVRGRAGLELFSYTHTGRRPESVANRQFIPPPIPNQHTMLKVCVDTKITGWHIFSGTNWKRSPRGDGKNIAITTDCWGSVLLNIQ